MARQVLENGVILPAEYSDDWYDDMTSNLTKLDDVIGSDSEKLSSSDVGAAALSNDYNDLDNLPTIPTVNDATLTIQKNGVDVQTFTANASSNVTCNITVPSKTSDLTNDSNFVDTTNSAVASGITSAKVTDYDTHIADTDKHVTTADKNRWNNQTYVFRYSSTVLVASSTNSNTLLDNTDNLKVGDKVIDSSGVLFSITAIDTQNSTFTIGTALIDLANDSDVVHKSGNETIGGNKTFSDLQIITYGTQYKGAIDAYILPEFAAGYSGLSIATLGFAQTLKIGNFVLDANNKPTLDSSKAYIQIATGENSNVNACVLEPRNSTSSSLGTSSNKWSKIYGTEYYYGSNNVEFSTKFVTTDTAQTISGAKTFSSDLKLKSVAGEYTVSSGNTSLSFYDKNSLLLSLYRQGVYGGGISYQSFNIVGYDSNNQQVNKSITFSSSYLDLSTAFLKPDTDNAIALGRTTNKWSDVQTYKVNNLEPSSLSLPSGRNTRIDISSYFTNLGSGDTNSYSVSANGYIYMQLKDIATVHCFDFESLSTTVADYIQTFSRGNDGQLYVLFPVKKDHIFKSTWYTTTTVTISGAYFIPCQGNV